MLEFPFLLQLMSCTTNSETIHLPSQHYAGSVSNSQDPQGGSYTNYSHTICARTKKRLAFSWPPRALIKTTTPWRCRLAKEGRVPRLALNTLQALIQLKTSLLSNQLYQDKKSSLIFPFQVQSHPHSKGNTNSFPALAMPCLPPPCLPCHTVCVGPCLAEPTCLLRS